MALRSGHGTGAGVPRVEVLPADELPAGVPAPARPAPARDASGRFVSSAGTKALARRGGIARAEALQLERLLGLWKPPDDHRWAPYARLAREWRNDHVAELGLRVGGGKVGVGAASIVSSAALQLAASRWLTDRGAEAGDAKMLLEGARLANASRQNVLAAYELTAREAEAERQGGRSQARPWFVEEEGAT